MLTNERENVCVVGSDEDQSIIPWRGRMFRFCWFFADSLPRK